MPEAMPLCSLGCSERGRPERACARREHGADYVDADVLSGQMVARAVTLADSWASRLRSLFWSGLRDANALAPTG
jgi:hypothetical protein